MLPASLYLLLSAALGVADARRYTRSPYSGKIQPIRRDSDLTSARQKIILGGGYTNRITIAEFDGARINTLGNASLPSGGAPTWLAFKEPNLLYSVNENGVDLSLFNVDLATNQITFVKSVNGTAGVVHLEFNKDKTRMVGSSFGTGDYDVWSLAADGSPTLLKSVATNSTGEKLGPNALRQAAPHAHQAVLDNSGRFFFVNDLGLDTVAIVDSQNDEFNVASTMRLQPGCGPRHGVFYPPQAEAATHYLVLCEMLNSVVVHKLNYTARADGVPTLLATQVISTFSDRRPASDKATPQAGEIVASADGKSVYVSNRVSFDPANANGTDTIVTFSATSVEDPQAAGTQRLTLAHAGTVGSLGGVPRMFSLSADKEQKLLFSTNQRSGAGVVAFSRCADSGKLQVVNGTVTPYVEFTGANGVAPDFGPQFILGLPEGSPAAATASSSTPAGQEETVTNI